jgi:hypothetical protein
MTYLWWGAGANYFLLSKVLNLYATESLSCGWTNQTGGLLSSLQSGASLQLGDAFSSLSLREIGTASLWLSVRLF